MWHIHGSYLYYLSHSRHEFLVPVRDGGSPRQPGLPVGGFPWPPNLREVAAEEVPPGPLRPEVRHDELPAFSCATASSSTRSATRASASRYARRSRSACP